MTGHSFTIREASGTLHEGIYIQGNGGTVRGKGSHERMQLAIERASAGLDTGLYEKRPGIVLGFHQNARERFDEREVDLRNATLVSSEG